MKTMNARQNMVNNQIRTWDVFDPKVIALFEDTLREDFVPVGFEDLAYADTSLPMGDGHLMLPPREQARLLQALNIQDSDRVLEIGTGTGYVTSMLATLSHALVTVDINPESSQAAAQRLAKLNLDSVQFRVGDGSQGWTQDGTFDVVAMLGSVEKLPASYLTQLNVGGRLFAIIGNEPTMEATLITRLSEQDWRYEVLFETVAPCLVHGHVKADFVF